MPNKKPDIDAKGTRPFGHETVLVVEDDQISLKFIQALLIDAGYKVQTAEDGLLCLDKVATIHPDLILMDVAMPKMDGIEACKRLKTDSAFCRIPVIFVTGNTDDQTLQAAFDAGASDYVRKPVQQAELLARVSTALAQCRMMRKQAEEEKLKGALQTAGGVCHELNQPLQYVLGIVQLLMMDLSSNKEVYAHLNAIRAAVEQMGAITHKLTEITHLRTRKYTGDRDIVDIRKSIASSQEK